MPPTLQQRLLRWLERPRVYRDLVLIAVLLALPCLGSGMVFDDYVLGVKAADGVRMPALPPAPLWLFTFTTGNVQQNHALMDEGTLLPWWSEPRHLNAFFRPLSSLTHLLDFRLWPNVDAAMHAHSLLWFAAVLLALGFVYRSLEPESPLLCALAFALFALDDAHGSTLGWIANRNALVSASLALPALAFHHRAVARGSWLEGLLAVCCIALGLCAGETTVCVVGYLVAYALCLDPRPLVTRALSLAPYGLLLIAHQALYRVLGLGSFGSLTYHHPLGEPLEFARMLAFNLPVLLSAQLFVPIADLAFWGNVSARPFLLMWAVGTLVFLARLASGSLRRDRMARFWALGMVLSAVPLTASLPGERLLLALGFGASPLLARLLMPLISPPDMGLAPRQRHVLRALFVLHLCVGPLGLPARAAAMSPVRNVSERLDRGLPRSPEIREQTAIVLNAPLDAFVSYLQVARAFRGQPRPAHLYWLSSASSRTRVVRVSERALQVEQEHGFLARPEETLYRARATGLEPGQEVQLAGMGVRVLTSMPDGRPRRVQFDFAEPLESKRYVFRVQQKRALVPWRPGAIGSEVELPAEDFFRLVIMELLRR